MKRPRSGLGPVDLLVDSFAGVVRRPARAAMTALGTVLGVAAFVATLGITSTAAGQIGSHFDRLAATEVVIQDGRPGADGPAFPADTEHRLAQLTDPAGCSTSSTPAGPSRWRW